METKTLMNKQVFDVRTADGINTLKVFDSAYEAVKYVEMLDDRQKDLRLIIKERTAPGNEKTNFELF